MYTVHVLGIDDVWREYHVFASRAAAEESAMGFVAEGFRAKVYRTASGPIGACEQPARVHPLAGATM
jgi:hypothetical protein